MKENINEIIKLTEVGRTSNGDYVFEYEVTKELKDFYFKKTGSRKVDPKVVQDFIIEALEKFIKSKEKKGTRKKKKTVKNKRKNS